MNIQTNKEKIILFLAIAFSLFIVFYGVYKPMKNEIESNLVDNFKLISKSKVDTFEGRIEKSLQGANSLSSRSMIRNKIVDYNSGLVSFAELQDFTENKYSEGVIVLNDITFAERYVDNKRLTSVYTDLYVQGLKSEYDLLNETDFSLVMKEDVYCLIVTSPIVYNDAIIGHDALGFCMNKEIESLNDSDIKFNVIDYEIEGLKQIEDFLYKDDSKYYYIKPIDESTHVVVTISTKDLFKTLNAVSQKSAFYVFFGYGLIILFFYFILIRNANMKIKVISSDRDIYKAYANYDTLTKVYSRLFLERFVEENQNLLCTVVLIDLNNFKRINDTYSHAIGDKILRIVASMLKDAIRMEDIVVRYGGDEFVVVLRNIDVEKAEFIIERVRQKLLHIEEFDFEIDFCYGVSESRDVKDIYQCIEEADDKMYEEKRIKKEKQ